MSEPEHEPAPAAAEGAEPAQEEDIKAKFREALERKQAQHGERNAQAQGGGGKAHNAHGPVGAKRSFRRKAG